MTSYIDKRERLLSVFNSSCFIRLAPISPECAKQVAQSSRIEIDVQFDAGDSCACLTKR